jgi:diguanylate cyclase (GGDEF)-like protein
MVGKQGVKCHLNLYKGIPLLFKLDQALNPKSARWFNRLLPVISILSAAILVYTIIFIVHALQIDVLADALELRTYDWRNSVALISDKHKPSKDIVILCYDDPSYSRYQNEYGNWPWPRYIHADVINYLNRAKAKTIIFDMMFISRDKGQEASDQKLIEAFKKNKNVFISMNFDNNKIVAEEAGQGLSLKDINNIEKLSVPVKTSLNPKNDAYRTIDQTGFYLNPSSTFNNVRLILPELVQHGERIGLINHMRDADGVSRRNPLIYRLVYQVPSISQEKPYHFNQASQQWTDKLNRSILKSGQLLNKQGEPQNELRVSYFPYLALLAHNTTTPGFSPKMSFSITEPGVLNFGNRHIPLTSDGSMLIHWYHHNVDQAEYQSQLESLEAQYQKKPSPLLQLQIDTLRAKLTQVFPNKPYIEIPIWQVIESVHHLKAGKMRPQDTKLMNFLKNKVIFIGTTSVSTYDIKTTPLEKVFPGVIMQAVIFDNIYQNKHYASQVSKPEMNLITSILCLSAALIMNRMRSAIFGFIVSLAMALLYGLIAFLAFQVYGLWLEVVMPLSAMFGISILVFMIKYVNKSQAYELTYQLATTDSMTGLNNYRFFKDKIGQFVQTGQDTGRSFSMLLVDIDFFKKFNDTYGHQAGDAVLRQVAQQLKASVRESDIVARYGGEEMAILLPQATERDALQVARKVVQNVAKDPFVLDENTSAPVTVSVGVATYPIHGQTADDIIAFADKGLYRAKESGRNQVGALFDTKPAS